MKRKQTKSGNTQLLDIAGYEMVGQRMENGNNNNKENVECWANNNKSDVFMKQHDVQDSREEIVTQRSKLKSASISNRNNTVNVLQIKSKDGISEISHLNNPMALLLLDIRITEQLLFDFAWNRFNTAL